METINSRKLLVGIALVATGILVVGVGVAIGGSVGGAIIAGAAAAA